MILIGADKGGVGKTTVARVTADYLQARGANGRLYDTELGRGDLARFATSRVRPQLVQASAMALGTSLSARFTMAW